MADIVHDLLIHAPPERVFEAITTGDGLAAWWTSRSSGEPVEGAVYELWFGPEYDWRGHVLECVPNAEIEWRIEAGDGDWNGTRVGFRLSGQDAATQVRFHHLGWPAADEHYRVSC